MDHPREDRIIGLDHDLVIPEDPRDSDKAVKVGRDPRDIAREVPEVEVRLAGIGPVDKVDLPVGIAPAVREIAVEVMVAVLEGPVDAREGLVVVAHQDFGKGDLVVVAEVLEDVRGGQVEDHALQRQTKNPWERNFSRQKNAPITSEAKERSSKSGTFR